MTQPHFFSSSDGTPLFGAWRDASTHASVENSGAAQCWVICAPFAEEEKSAHRTLAELCEALSARGQSTLFFAYGGTGDSGGDFSTQSLTSWREDILDACAEAKRRTGSTPGLIGLRLGASLALQTARAVGAQNLILLEPVLSGRSYLMQLGARKKLRAAMTEKESGSERQTVTGQATIPRFEDLDGWPLGASLREELNELDLMREIPTLTNNSEVLVLQVGPREQIAPALQKISQELKAKNASCEIVTRAVVMPPFWNRLDLVSSTPLLEAVSGFVFRVSGCETSTRISPAPIVETSEKPITFQNARGENLIGIWHNPEPGTRNPKPVIMMLHGWTGYRSGPHQMLTRAARRFAAQGFGVLRFDFSGRGDSDGTADLSTLATMQDDARAALDWLAREQGTAHVTLLGLCSGCEIALAASAIEPEKIENLILWSAPVFAAGQSEERISRKRKSHLKDYARKMLRPATWAKIMGGKIDVGGVSRVLKSGGEQESKNREADEEPGQLPRGWREDILRRFKKTRARTFLVYGTADPTTEEALKWHQELFAAREYSGGHDSAPEVRFVEGANHSYYGLNWEEEVFVATGKWLQIIVTSKENSMSEN